MAVNEEIVWSDCRSCKNTTKHSVLGSANRTTPAEYYHDETKYFLLECNGCSAISFRKEYHDYEVFFQTGPDDYAHDVSIEIFPHQLKDHTPIDSSFEIPRVVERIYKESLLAVQEGAYTLAGLGLRATIEAICNEKEVKGRNLQLRIGAMQKSGMISKTDAERLHAIRFMGNDSAHEIKKASEKSVRIALRIIEHILLSVYVFDEEVSKHLETPVSNLTQILPVLALNLASMEKNSSFTLTKWLGPSKRRVLEGIEQIERDLIESIRNGEVEGVEVVQDTDAKEGSDALYRRIETGDENQSEGDDEKI